MTQSDALQRKTPPDARLRFSPSYIERRLAEILTRWGTEQRRFDAVAPILHGGLWLTYRLLSVAKAYPVGTERLWLTSTFYAPLVASSYEGQERQTTIDIHADFDGREVEGKHILLLDDIADSGRTLESCRQVLIEGMGAASVTSLVILRRHDCPTETEALFDLEPGDDDWFFGCGMDLNGHFRFLDSVWSLDGEA